MKSTLKDGGGKNLLFESTIFTGNFSSNFDLQGPTIHQFNGDFTWILGSP